MRGTIVTVIMRASSGLLRDRPRSGERRELAKCLLKVWTWH